MKLRLILLFTVLVSCTTFSQLNDNWEWLNPKPQGNTLYNVDFTTNTIGYASGDYGTVLRTQDGGATWNKLPAVTAKNLFSMCFTDQNTGYIGGPSQLLRKTTDGGQTWNALQLPVGGPWDTAYSVMDIKFPEANIGYVVGFFQLECKIWKTTDAGNSWQTQSTGGANYLMNLYFIDANTGFAFGGPTYSEVVRTTNGGVTWQQVGQENYIARSMCFINATTGVIGSENGRIFRTTNGGANWTFAYCPSSLDVMSIQFTDENTGFGFGTGSVYIKTTNGGMNWDEYPIGAGATNRQYFGGDITPNGTMQFVGNYGAMVRSTNGGANFVAPQIVTEHSISNIKFIDQNTGYAVAGFGEGDILKTTNAGATWVSQVSSYTLPLYGISFTDPQTGYLAGSINLKKTTNGGTNWVDVYTSTINEIFTDIFFTDVNTGYAVGSYGKLLKTTNAGNSWTSSTIPISGSIVNSLFFVNSTTGFVVGDNNSAQKTTNAGVTWQNMSVSSGFMTLNNIFFDDEQTGYISGSGGLFKTTNSGASWFSLSVSSGGYNNVQFRGNFGYATGGSGKIIKSTDAGASWIVQPTVTTNPLYALYFNSDDFIYAGGVLGTMIKTIPMELILTPISGNSNEIPKSFYLNQNYPNPFNPVTTIKFGVVKQGNVSLKIYDITGKVVKVLKEGNVTPGSYEIKWDAGSFASGIYFYTLTTSDFSETKKMILVK